jgi:signal transduction histidine kinase
VAFAITTYYLVRSYLVDERQDAAMRQAFANARLTRNALRSLDVDVASLLTTIRGESGSDVVARVDDRWFASSVAVGDDTVPPSLRALVLDGEAGRQIVRGPDGELILVVGTPLAAVDAGYFEVFHLDDLERTLDLLRAVLVAAGLTTAVLAAGVGRFAAGRVVEPLGPIASAASRIADGELDARLPDSRDPDLDELTDAFNSMAATLEERLEREQRFASDVSHELRTPLAAFRAALEVIERRRRDLPAGVDDAVDVLRTRTATFEELVLDLLEISRFDADAIRLHPEELEVEQFVRQTLRAFEAPDVEVHLDTTAPTTFVADRRRLAQAFGNIIANADVYAGGLTRIGVQGDERSIRFLLDDGGPGIDPSERSAIFERFARGRAGRQAGSSSGTGLGLALVAAQVALHDGAIEVSDAPSGGARFTIHLPRNGPP